MYRIEYEYYDKRGHVRNKKIECGGLDRVKYHCNTINNLTDHKPIRTPRIVETMKDKPDKEISYIKIIKGEI